MQNIEDIYRLSPTQHGMLFHSLYHPESGIYFEQFSCTLRGALDALALRRACDRVTERHPALRTSFHWTEGDEPLQVVHRQVELPWEELDWREMNEAAQKAYLSNFLQADCQRGFDLAQSPLMRMTLIRLTEETHYFLWSFHHLLLDGWSSLLVLREVFALYEAFRLGQDLELALPRPYRDYILWLQAQDLVQAEAFWRETLHGFDAPTPLGVDLAAGRLPAESGERVKQRVRLPAATTARLQSFARRQGLTLNTLVQGAWALLLGRYSGQQDVVLGVTVSGRPPELAGVEAMVGLFINTLPLRVAIPAEAVLLPWLQELQAQQFAMRQYKYSPLVDVQGWSQVSRGRPLFESILVFENYAAGSDLGVGSGSLEIQGAAAVEKTNYPLTVLAVPSEELAIEIVYDNWRFDQATVARMLAYFRTLLEAMVADAAQQLADLPRLTADDAQQLQVWNRTRTAYPCQRCIHELFEAQAAQTPHAVALVFEDAHLTYGQLNRRANQMARHLRALGVGPEMLVGICVERSLEMVIGLLGILKAGGAYLPLDPDYPPERLTFMLMDAGSPLLLTQQPLLARLPVYEVWANAATPRQVVCLDTDWPLMAQQSGEGLPNVTTADNLVYVMYTSGSTGRPKGTSIVHRAVVRLVRETNFADLSAEQIWLQFAPLSFDASTLELWGSLLNGGRLVIFPPHTPSLDELGQVLLAQQVTSLWLTAGLFHLMVDERLADLAHLKQLLAGGDVLSPPHVQKVLHAPPNCRLINGYGPTENTTFTTCYPMTPGSQVRSPLPIGRPIANTQVYILDDRLQPLPIGVAGELYIGGDGLARDYLHRAALTAERFVPNPFAEGTGARLYKTGDLARYLPDGNIEFMGRLDHQVKVRGFRIELGEIEAVLVQHSALRETVVVARQDEPGNKQLVAYLVPEDRESPPLAELREFLQARLPDYMLPAAFVTLEALPLNPNGKVDRQALPVPQRTRADLKTTFVPPRNEVEERIAAVWTEVLGIEKVGIDDNFFDLGGESFKAIKAVRRMGDALSVVDLFTHPTIRELADYLYGGQPRGDGLLHELTRPVPLKARVVSLVCLPFGGGSAISYQALADALPKNYSLYAVELPGHDFGQPDEPLQPSAEVVQRCVAEILRDVRGPIALYGHCMGGALAIRIARLLEEAGVELEGVFIGGHFPSPRLPGKFFDWWNRTVPWQRWASKRVHLQMLQVNGFFTDLVDPEQQEFVVRNYLHDVQEGEDYYSQVFGESDGRKLKAPILCIMGQMDRMTEFYEERYLDWEFFSDEVDLVVLPQAGHYFVKYQALELSQIIPHQLAEWRQQAEAGAETRAAERQSRERHAAPSLRTFFIVALGQFISLIGTALTTFALGVWVFEEMANVSDLAVVFIFALLPGILASPIAGAVADRYDRRSIMILSDTAGACATLVVALLLWADALQLWHIYIAASMASISNAFQGPAYTAAITQLVPKRYLGRANGIVQLGWATGQLLAPLLGGVLVMLVGLHGVVLIDFATFLFAVTTLLLVRFPDTLFRRLEEPLLREVVRGWQFIVRRRGLVAVVVFFVISNFFSSILNVLSTPLVLSSHTAAVLGTVTAANGLGVLLGGLVMGLWGGTRRRADGMVGFVILWGLSAMVVGLRPAPIFPMIGLFGVGLALAIINAHWQTLVQTKVGLELQGRALSTTQMLAWSMIPLGNITAGTLADHLFEPLLASDGALAGTIGQLIGSGPGRGMGLLVILAGALMVLWGVLGYRHRPLRFVEDELPNAIPEGVIVADKDRLQELANRQFLVETA